ncbi:MAG: N-acetylmuramoyl-L-alanine amidase [Rhodobacteraceae bacterium]|nr:N-acetylmuramoyl-L-alanine amidase [Paracoccaceae bacterium]
MINRHILFCLTAIFYLTFGPPQPLMAAEVLPQGTAIVRDSESLNFTITLSKKTPFRVYTLDNPRRLLVDLGKTSLENMPRGLAAGIPEISALRYGVFQLGQSRIVLDLAAPLIVNAAFTAEIGGGATRITIQLAPVSTEEFAAASIANPASLWRTEQLHSVIEGGSGLPLIAIDAGHGGLDNGAQQDDVFEKNIVLKIAKLLRDVLLEDGHFRVILTRDSDVYIPLGERVEIARRAGARAFISLHADFVTLGRARGTTVFSLSEAGESQQAVTIATLENRSDLVAGISVEGEDDQLTQVLLQLAHRETDALSNRFADTMAEALWFHNELDIKSRRMAGGFRVLRAPDIPSVLIELGFISDETDLERLQDSEWQLNMAHNLRNGLATWLQVEDEMRGLLRN